MRALLIAAIAASSASISAFSATGAEAQVLEIDYQDFKVWVDCDRRSPVMFFHELGPDNGELARISGYQPDPNFSADCQSLSNDTFQSHVPEGAPSYDIGHQAAINHFDFSIDVMARTNFWTNLMPQTRSMNRGAWQRTEYIADCLREETSVEVWGGAIWAGAADDDYFVASHGMPTPSAFWKIVIRGDNRESQAWLIPNATAPHSTIDNWLVPVQLIETLTLHSFDVADKAAVPETSWTYRNDCRS